MQLLVVACATFQQSLLVRHKAAFSRVAAMIWKCIQLDLLLRVLVRVYYATTLSIALVNRCSSQRIRSANIEMSVSGQRKLDISIRLR
jgi:hypothetical protein